MKDQQNQSLGIKIFGHSPETNRNLTRCENLEEGEEHCACPGKSHDRG